MSSERFGDKAEARIYDLLEQAFGDRDAWEIGWSMPSGLKRREIDFLVISKWNGAALVEAKSMPLVPVKQHGDWVWLCPSNLALADRPYPGKEPPHKQMRACMNAASKALTRESGVPFPPNLCQFLVLCGTDSALWKERGPDLPKRPLTVKPDLVVEFHRFEDFIICLGDQLEYLPQLIMDELKVTFELSHKSLNGDFKPGRSELALWDHRHQLLTFAGHRLSHGMIGLVDRLKDFAAKHWRVAALMLLALCLGGGLSAWLLRPQPAAAPQTVQTPPTLAPVPPAVESPAPAIAVAPPAPPPPATDAPAAAASVPEPGPTQSPVPAPVPKKTAEPAKPKPHPVVKTPAPTQTSLPPVPVAAAPTTKDMPEPDAQGRSCVMHYSPGVIDGETVQLKQKFCIVNGGLKAVFD